MQKSQEHRGTRSRWETNPGGGWPKTALDLRIVRCLGRESDTSLYRKVPGVQKSQGHRRKRSRWETNPSGGWPKAALDLRIDRCLGRESRDCKKKPRIQFISKSQPNKTQSFPHRTSPQPRALPFHAPHSPVLSSRPLPKPSSAPPKNRVKQGRKGRVFRKGEGHVCGLNDGC